MLDKIEFEINTVENSLTSSQKSFQIEDTLTEFNLNMNNLPNYFEQVAIKSLPFKAREILRIASTSVLRSQGKIINIEDLRMSDFVKYPISFKS